MYRKKMITASLGFFPQSNIIHSTAPVPQENTRSHSLQDSQCSKSMLWGHVVSKNRPDPSLFLFGQIGDAEMREKFPVWNVLPAQPSFPKAIIAQALSPSSCTWAFVPATAGEPPCQEQCTDVVWKGKKKKKFQNILSSWPQRNVLCKWKQCKVCAPSHCTSLPGTCKSRSNHSSGPSTLMCHFGAKLAVIWRTEKFRSSRV